MAEKGGGAYNPGSSKKKDTAGKAKIGERRKIDDSDDYYQEYAQFKIRRNNPRPCSSAMEELFTVELTPADVDEVLNLTQLQASMLVEEYSRPVLENLISFSTAIDLFDEHKNKYAMQLAKEPKHRIPVADIFHYLNQGWLIVVQKRELKAGDVVKFYKLSSVGLHIFVKGRVPSFFIHINKPDAE
ncbi:hypothetical protein ACP275_14G055000 [Erythranthe tilingii]